MHDREEYCGIFHYTEAILPSWRRQTNVYATESYHKTKTVWFTLSLSSSLKLLCNILFHFISFIPIMMPWICLYSILEYRIAEYSQLDSTTIPK